MSFYSEEDGLKENEANEEKDKHRLRRHLSILSLSISCVFFSMLAGKKIPIEIEKKNFADDAETIIVSRSDEKKNAKQSKMNV